jgi:hypothetical protein
MLMPTRTKLTLAGLAATLLMGFAVTTANANHLSVSNQFFRIVWNPLTFVGEGGTTIKCPATLEGSFHERTIAKTIGRLVGYVSRAIFGSGAACQGGSFTVLTATLPWHVTYEGFSGRLPAITSVRLLLRRVAFVEEVFSVRCLYKENGTSQAAGELLVEAGGNAKELTADRTITLPLFEGSTLFCPTNTGFEGTGEVTLLGSSTTRIRVTLI